MGKPVTLFSGFSQKENRTTNYCLLVLKMLYEENPKYLGEFLSGIANEKLGGDVGIKFHQQVKKQNSVPDGMIFQRPITIFIETKNDDWFHTGQLKKHLEALCLEPSGEKLLIALSHFESLSDDRFAVEKQYCKNELGGEVHLVALTFEDFLHAIPTERISKNLADAVDEFRQYLDEQNLLPSWKTRLDVINCAGSYDAVINQRAYVCPGAGAGGAYSHRRCRYFGSYRDKCVDHVAKIRAVVEIDAERNATLRWNNSKELKGTLKNEAHEKHCGQYPNMLPALVFLLGELHPTDFRKASKGGMYGSKKYFDVDAKSVEELAVQLGGRTWEAWERGEQSG